MVEVEFRPDRLVFRVFTSRRTTLAELASRMTLRDSLGTKYIMQPFAEDIDGKGTFEFTPGVPPTAKSLHFGEPGRSLVWARLSEPWARRNALVADGS